MRTIVILILLAGFLACTEKVNRETVNYEEDTILVGEINWDGLSQAPYNEWFSEYYFGYGVDSETLNQVGDQLEGVDIVMFLGTWCEDSQVQVPQFYRILDFSGYNLDQMQVFALEKLEDGELVSPENIEEKYGIGFVPTMIFFRDGEELGRITEFPQQTLERDLLKIVSQ